MKQLWNVEEKKCKNYYILFINCKQISYEYGIGIWLKKWIGVSIIETL